MIMRVTSHPYGRRLGCETHRGVKPVAMGLCLANCICKVHQLRRSCHARSIERSITDWAQERTKDWCMEVAHCCKRWSACGDEQSTRVAAWLRYQLR